MCTVTFGPGSVVGVATGYGLDGPGIESVPGHESVELYLYSPYGPYGLYRASVPVQ
jgi:hypothetical protein